ncbi:MAG: hypothetical protein JWL83_2428 [Actinomycetia bacterium]|nr:hypothetical protein [Actinomycetes bacterium]
MVRAGNTSRRVFVRREMPVPLPSADDQLLGPMSEAEVFLLARGIASAVAPEGGLTTLQAALLPAVSESMTGFRPDVTAVEPLSASGLAEGLRRRNIEFRTRIVQLMVLAELILVPLPEDVAARVERYAHELMVDEGMLRVARDYAKGSLGLALIDFDRNGYTASWQEHQHAALHTTGALAEAWQESVNDAALAQRWADLERCPDGAIGRAVFDFYRARGFSFPGTPGSAPPLLAQHDWVHVVADYGTKVESEIEVFGLIARAIPSPQGFSLLAMVIGLFETGYVHAAAGIFEYDRGHLSEAGMPERLANAMYRGAMCGKDLLAVDWFEYADWPLDAVRREFNIVDKSVEAIDAGSVGPWHPDGISPFQLEAGRRARESEN